jgi:hypothetical protein
MTRRRLQFSLASIAILFLLVAPPVGYWVYASERAKAARSRVEELEILYSMGQVTGHTFLQASRKWCLAESAVPFSEKRKACQEHFDNMQWHLYLVQETMWGGTQREHDQRRNVARKYLAEANRWLAQGHP